MGVSQPLNLADKLREALMDAQRVLDSSELKGKVTLNIDSGGGQGVESSISRTEKAASDASRALASSEASQGPLSPNDRLVDALSRLMKAVEGMADSFEGKGGGGRRRRAAASSSGEEAPENESTGYVNPYVAQGLIQNPLSTAKSSLISALMGGSGGVSSGLIGKLLGGSEGFSLGKALGMPVGESGAYLSGGAVAGLSAAVPIAAFLGMTRLQSAFAKDRLQDSTDYASDIELQRSTGLNWREGVWEDSLHTRTESMHSRYDIHQKDIRSLTAGAGVRFEGLDQSTGGTKQTFDLLEQVVLSSRFKLGIDSGQMGSLLGAGVRSGMINMNEQNGSTQILRFLGLIEQWTKNAAEHGLSTSEAIQAMTKMAQRQESTAGIVTSGAMTSMISMRERVMGSMMEDFQRPGTEMAVNALMAAPAGDTQTVQLMNEMLNSDGSLSENGKKIAIEALGIHTVASMVQRYGRKAGVFIAQQVVQTPTGAGRTREAMAKGMAARGASGLQIGMTAFGGNLKEASIAMDVLEGSNGSIFEPKNIAEGGGTGRLSEREQKELDLELRGQVLERRSGMDAEHGEAIEHETQSLHAATKAVINFTSQLVMASGQLETWNRSTASKSIQGIPNASGHH